MKASKNSYILNLYLIIAIFYYISNSLIRPLLFFGILLISFSLLVNFKNQFSFKNRINVYRVASILFFGILFIQLYNDTFIPFIFYIFSAPIMVLFILQNKFETKLLKIPIYIISILFFIYFVIFRTLEGFFYQTSVNYVSVLMIMNIVIINSIERVQNERLSITPAILGLTFSLLAMGRAGIICTLLLFLVVLFYNWNLYSTRIKLTLIIVIVFPLIFIILFYIDSIINFVSNLSVLNRFDERGIESPSRNILMREYIDNLNLKNILLGFNFEHNKWFIHYGQNPHNSYLRLHHFSGVFSFLILIYILIILIKLILKDKFLFCLLLIVLIRSWTDSILFFTIYDAVVLYVLLIPYYYSKKFKYEFRRK